MTDQQKSISDEFRTYASIILVGLILVIAWMTWIVVADQNQKIIRQMNERIFRVDRLLSDTLDHGFYLLNAVRDQIAAAGYDEKQVFNLLSAFKEDVYKYSWTDQNNILRVGSVPGTVETYLDLSDREYIKNVRKEPKKVHINRPIISKLFGRPRLPISTGAFRENGEFVGTITTLIELDVMSIRFNQAIANDAIHLLIVSDEFHEIVQSPSDKFYGQHEIELEDLKSIDFQEDELTIIRQPSFFEDKDYIAARKSAEYPFYIVLAYDGEAAQKEILQSLIPRILEIIIVAGFLIVMLWLFQKRIVQPVMVLADAADQIAHGQEKVEIPTQGPAEITKLAEHLEQIQLYVTELRRVRKELVRRNQELEGKREEGSHEVEFGEGAKSEVLSNISHELRTPLNTILAMSESLKEAIFGQAANPKQEEYHRDIYQSAVQMLQLLNDWVDLSRLEAGMLEFKEEEVSVAEVVDYALNMVEERAREKQLLIRREVEQGLPYLRADEARMKQVVLNLVTNAVKFTREGGVIKVIAGTLREGEEVTGLIIKVEDTGVGMKPEDIPKALSKFVPVDNPFKDENKKAGLGLPLAHELTELMGGDFHIESEEGKGTTVTITFPDTRFYRTQP